VAAEGSSESTFDIGISPREHERSHARAAYRRDDKTRQRNSAARRSLLDALHLEESPRRRKTEELGTTTKEVDAGRASDLGPGRLVDAGRLGGRQRLGDVLRREPPLSAPGRRPREGLHRSGKLPGVPSARIPLRHRDRPHGARPQGALAKIPGLGAANMLLTRMLPLRRADVEQRDGTLYVR
jgi:hypothetical protein